MPSIIPPTWADINFGLNGTDQSAYRSFVHVYRGPIENRRAEFVYPGVHGVMVQYLGKGGRQIVWTLTVLSETLASLTALEDAIEAKLQDGGYTMTLHGRTIYNVELVDFVSTEPVGGVGGTFSFIGRYALTFRELRP